MSDQRLIMFDERTEIRATRGAKVLLINTIEVFWPKWSKQHATIKLGILLRLKLVIGFLRFLYIFKDPKSTFQTSTTSMSIVGPFNRLPTITSLK